MTLEKEYFISLLSSYVNRTSPKGEAVDFGELFRIAQTNDLGGIIATQLKKVDSQFQPYGDIKSHFNQVLGYTVKNSALRETAYILTKQFLNTLEVKHIFVKGVHIKDYYPDPEMRTSGDIDVIVEPASIEKLHKAAKEQGIKITNYVSNMLSLKINSVDLEIHADADVMTDYFDSIFEIAEKVGEFEYILNEYDELLYVLCHLAKHLAYTGAGIRMLLDIDLCIRGIDAFSIDKFIALCDKAGVRKTTEVLLSLCNIWFNTPVARLCEIDGELINNLVYVFIDCGSFGYEISNIPTKYLNENNSKAKVLFKMAFPDKRHLKLLYPYYNSHPFLYPIARINRLYDGLFKRKNQTKKVINEINNNSGSQERLELLKELEINQE